MGKGSGQVRVWVGKMKGKVRQVVRLFDGSALELCRELGGRGMRVEGLAGSATASNIQFQLPNVSGQGRPWCFNEDGIGAVDYSSLWFSMVDEYSTYFDL